MHALIARTIDHYKHLGWAIAAYTLACMSISPIIARGLYEQEFEFNVFDVNIWICLTLGMASVWYLRQSHMAYVSARSERSVIYEVLYYATLALQIVLFIPYIMASIVALQGVLTGGRSFG